MYFFHDKKKGKLRESNNCCVKKINNFSYVWTSAKLLMNKRNTIKLLALNISRRNKLRYPARAS